MKKSPLGVNELKSLRCKTKEAREAILKMTTLSASGHPGGSMSSIDFLALVYELADVDKTMKEDRDIVVVSNGHISPAVYSTLGLNGFFNLDDAIAQFRLAGSIFEGHIEPDVPGVELATGNLGQGLSSAAGMALAGKLKQFDNQVFVIMGDGEQQKGQISEARRFIKKFGLNNITVIIDYNKLQIGGDISTVMPQDIKANFESDGWKVLQADGHNLEAMQDAIFKAKDIDSPVMILARTIMGKGVSFMENKEKYHGSTLSEEDCAKAIKELDGTNNLEYYKELRNKFVAKPTQKPAILSDFSFNTGKNILYSKSTDNRSAWGNALTDIADNNKDNLTKIAVFDCDLAGSVKVNDFAKNHPDYFFQSGIMEHNTASVAGSISKMGHQVFFCDFGVFGIDETYNQHRLNDINHTNLKVITTHVGLDVGEDGKTHQCIDYIALFRNLYNFKVLVPADPNQTDHIVRYVANKKGNYLIAMGRSKLDPITNENNKLFFDENYKFEFGKMDLLHDGRDAALIVTGTLAPKAVCIAEYLRKLGINLQLWNTASPTHIDEEALGKAAATGTIFTYEDHNVNTGLGCSIANKLLEMGKPCKLVKFGVENYAISGKSEDVYKHCKLDEKSIINRIKESLQK